jgi:glycosyltransferase involved in cell wall biosynthesis
MRLIDQVIDAFALLHQRTPARLRIAGFIEDPAYHQALLAQIESLGLSDAVSFVDPVPSPAEDPARAEVDLVWMISLSGHIGYAGIEAMAAGLPTLLLEVDRHADPESVDPELAGLICATPQQLVQRSLELKTDPGVFREQQAQLVRQRFITTREAIDELTAFYLGQR